MSPSHQTASTVQDRTTQLDVIIVGAGAAGIGMALALDRLPGLKYGVLEGGRVGESFRRWPAQTRFITPSFPSNPFGLADLNAINAQSSPATQSGVEHLSGDQYADYLTTLVESHALPVVCDCPILWVSPMEAGGFLLSTDRGELRTRLLIWATGEYLFPDLTPFPGAQWCPHYAQVRDWQAFDASRYSVIGGYESGVDAAINLVRLGCHVRLLARQSRWDSLSADDPSLSLSPYSRERLHEALESERLDIVFGVDVVKVSRQATGEYRIHAADGRHWDEVQPPILGTGFLSGGGAQQIAELWEWTDDGQILLTHHDESTLTPGLFLVGPQVRHAPHLYCFIYKFRQRFALIAREIAQRLALDATSLPDSGGTWGAFDNDECCEDCPC